MRTTALIVQLSSIATAATIAGCTDAGSGQVAIALRTTDVQLVPPAVDVLATDTLDATVDAIFVHVAPSDRAPTRPAGVDNGSGTPQPPAPDGADGSTWVSVLSAPLHLDLLHATGPILAAADAPTGRVTQVRFRISGDVVFDQSGTRAVVACPSCTETGIKVVTRGDLVIPDGGTLDLSFELGGSFDVTALRLDPVVRLE